MFFFFWGPLFLLFPIFFIFIVFRLFFPRIGRSHRGHNPFLPVSFPEDNEVNSDAAAIYRLAHKLRGRITLSDIVIETGMDPREAERIIESMIDGVRVRMEVDEKGIVYYEFPEILARLKGE